MRPRAGGAAPGSACAGARRTWARWHPLSPDIGGALPTVAPNAQPAALASGSTAPPHPVPSRPTAPPCPACNDAAHPTSPHPIESHPVPLPIPSHSIPSSPTAPSLPGPSHCPSPRTGWLAGPEPNQARPGTPTGGGPGPNPTRQRRSSVARYDEKSNLQGGRFSLDLPPTLAYVWKGPPGTPPSLVLL